jgi:hypothetical protein
MRKITPAVDRNNVIAVLSLIAGLFVFGIARLSAAPAPFNESGGMVVFEAENYHAKIRNGVPRDFYTFPTSSSTPKPDPDGPHTGGAGNGKYLEILPDNRVTHDDPLQKNVNFFDYGSNAPQVHYNVRINSGGRYYVWVRAYSTGTEDNGVHVGYDGSWPTSGKAMQWCSGKNAWTWSSARRVPDNHCGVRNTIYLDLSAGNHTIKLGQREDGFEFDRIIMVKDRYYTPSGVGPAESKRTDGTGGSSGGGTTPTNSAPNAYAGPDATINLSDTLNLNGSASDDGLPDGQLDTYWSEFSGPAAASIANPSALQTTVSFSVVGFYVLQLRASDGELGSFDKIGIEVTDAQDSDGSSGGSQDPVNEAPSVNAGPDASIELNDTFQLKGSASDDGLPDGQLDTYWSEFSGPAAASIANPSALQTTVSFSVVGFYVLQLRASDGELGSFDKIGIEVTDAQDSGSEASETAVGTEGAFPQGDGAQGLVVLEAEKFNEAISNGNHFWGAVSFPGQYSGNGAMEAAPDDGRRISSNYEQNSPNLKFDVDFNRTGRHYIWVRVYAAGNDNSLHAGINGSGVVEAMNITAPALSAWVWANQSVGKPATVNVPSKGVQTVDIWMREDGLILDKVVLTTDPDYVPSGLGPDEIMKSGLEPDVEPEENENLGSGSTGGSDEDSSGGGGGGGCFISFL